MKVAVYSIALNEEKFVERWYECAKEADYLLIADTGSSDRTIELAKSLGINVVEISIKPWRFDDARNASLAVIPGDIDYCIALDLDETLVPGWRKHLEVAYKNKWTRPRYLFTTSWNPDGSPGLQFSGIRIHARQGYRWVYPIHEVPEPYGITPTEGWIELQAEHHPDNTKSRGQYLPLLEIAARENPLDDRCAFYYGRELYFRNSHTAAANAEEWNLRAISQDPSRRESYVQTAEYYYNNKRWEECLKYAELAVAITEKPLDYFCEPWAWDFRAYDYAAIAAFWLGKTELALTYGEKALEVTPTDERLQRNLEFYKEKDGTNGSDSI